MPAISKFACKYIKLWTCGSKDVVWGSFDCDFASEAFLKRKVVEVNGEVVVSRREVSKVWLMMERFASQLAQLLQTCQCDMGTHVIVEKNCSLSVSGNVYNGTVGSSAFRQLAEHTSPQY